MAKMTQKEALQFLKQLGVDVELVDKDEDSEFKATENQLTEDALLQLVDASRRPVIEQMVLQAKNKEVHDSVTAKVNGGLRKALIAKGITSAELENKSYQEMVDIAQSHFGKSANADVEAVNAQLREVMAAHETKESELNKSWQSKLDALSEKLSRKQIVDVLKGLHKNAKGLPTNANVDILSEDFLNYLNTKAVVKLSEDGSDIELYQKDNPSARMISNSNFTKIDGMLKEYYVPRGLWNEDNRNVNAIDAMKNQNKINMNTTVNKDGKMETPAAKQLEAVAQWANNPAA